MPGRWCLRERTRCAALAALLLAFAGAVAAAPARAAEGDAARELAERYAPVVALKEQAEPCDPDGEAYRPVPVETVLGRDDVRLVDARGRELVRAPTAADLVGRPDDVYLDLPGSPLAAGCTYERWFRQIAKGVPTTAYARVVAEPGEQGIALQYWLYYPFNDFNNKHESDWEMIQLLFDAGTPEDALAQAPAQVGFSQHEGAERARWDDDKLERQGDRPVVHPGAGSHANYFGERLWLGHSAQEGFGCDDTRGPTRREPARVVMLPEGPRVAEDDPLAWVAYKGHWGQRAGGPNNGPTGPSTKAQWSEPITWAEEEWRDASSAVPLTRTLGPSTTDLFCGAVALGSRVYLRFLRTPAVVLGGIGLVLAAAVWLGRRTRWRPGEPLPVRRRRTAGEILLAAARLYRLHARLFAGIGLVFVPLAAVTMVAQWLVLDLSGLGTLVRVSIDDPFAAAVIPLLLGAPATVVGTVAVTAAAAAALARVADGRPADPLGAYRAILPAAGTIGWATLRITVVATLLTVSIVGIPIAIAYLVRRAVVTQAAALETTAGAGAAISRSRALVRGNGVRVLGVTGLVNTAAALLGPIAGVVVLFATSSSLSYVNGVSSLAYALVMPYVGLVLALLFYDLRERVAAAPG